MFTIESIGSAIERCVARHLLVVIAVAQCADITRLRAEDATAGLSVRLTLELPEGISRDLRVWEELPLSVTLENVGEARGVPAAQLLLTGTYGGARFVAHVRNLAAPNPSEQEFQLDAIATGECYSRTQMLQHGELSRYEGSLSVRLDSISTGPGTIRNVLVSAFPTPGRYSVRVVYTLEEKSASSAPLEIDVLPVAAHAADALTALRDMQREGLWIYRPSLMPSVLQPAQLARIHHLATTFQSNAYSDLACYALARVGVRRALDPSVSSATREGRLREALAYVERVSSPRFTRRAACEKLRGRILELRSR